MNTSEEYVHFDVPSKPLTIAIVFSIKSAKFATQMLSKLLTSISLPHYTSWSNGAM